MILPYSLGFPKTQTACEMAICALVCEITQILLGLSIPLRTMYSGMHQTNDSIKLKIIYTKDATMEQDEFSKFVVDWLNNDTLHGILW